MLRSVGLSACAVKDIVGLKRGVLLRQSKSMIDMDANSNMNRCRPPRQVLNVHVNYIGIDEEVQQYRTKLAVLWVCRHRQKQESPQHRSAYCLPPPRQAPQVRRQKEQGGLSGSSRVLQHDCSSKTNPSDTVTLKRCSA